MTGKIKLLSVLCLITLLFMQISCGGNKPQGEVSHETEKTPAAGVSQVPGKEDPVPTGSVSSKESPSPMPERDKNIEIAEEFISKGNLDDAEKKLKQQPESLQTIALLGVVERERGNYKEALKYFDQALKINPDHIKALKYRGYLHYLTGDYEDALKDLNQVIKLNQDDPEAYYKLAMTYQKMGKKAEAEENAMKGMDAELAGKTNYSWESMNSKDPQRFAIIQGITGEKGKEKIIEIARRDYEKNASNQHMAYSYAILLYDYGKTDESKKVLEQALNKVGKQHQHKIHKALGEFYTMERQFDNAQKEYELAIKTAPSGKFADNYRRMSELYTLSGEAYIEQKQFTEAEEALKKALENAEQIGKLGNTSEARQKSTAVYVSMSRIYLKQKKTDKAEEMVKKAESLTPEGSAERRSIDLLIVKAECLAQKNEHKKAVELLKNGIAYNPDSPDELYLEIAKMYADTKDKTNTAVYIKKSLDTSGNRKRVGFYISENPEFAFIKNDPEIKQMLK